MIYPATFEQKIGFDRLREQVAARCTMRAARERLAAGGRVFFAPFFGTFTICLLTLEWKQL